MGGQDPIHGIPEVDEVDRDAGNLTGKPVRPGEQATWRDVDSGEQRKSQLGGVDIGQADWGRGRRIWLI